jgi:peptide/nickel transport system ATP-binding protein
MIELRNVTAGYGHGKDFVAAVDNVSLTVKDDEILGVAGESGCGKSTLMRSLYGDFSSGLTMQSGSIKARFTDPDSGHVVERDGANLRNLWWNAISYVPQGSMSVLNPVMRVGHQIMDALPKRERTGSTKERRARLVKFLEGLGLPESVLDSYPHQLSGGMRQRVLVALAAFIGPRLILADEPTTALDVVVQKRILIMLFEIQRRLKNALVLVSHDLGVHFQITDRLAIAYAGKLVEIGPTAEVFSAPQHPYTQALIGALPRIGQRGERVGLEGRPPSLASPPVGCRFAPRCREAQAICRTSEPSLEPRTIGRPVACHFR